MTNLRLACGNPGKKTWERFEIATGIGEAGDKKRVCTLLSIIGEDAVKVFDTFEYGDGESEDSIQDVLNKFEEYCNPRRNTIYERYKFQCRHQEAGESGSCFLTELRIAADSCDFGTITASEILRDRFVHGLRDAKMRERLLRETNLTLDRAYAMVQAAEATTEQMHVMSGEQAVSAVHQRGNRGQQGQQGYKSRDMLKNSSYIKCNNCSYEHAPMKCPAFGKECHRCGRVNHFQNRCRQKNVQQVQGSESDNEFEVGTLTTVNSVGNKRRAMITLEVGNNGVPTRFQIDSGADCCVLPRDEYIRVTGDESLTMLKQVKPTIVTYVGTREKALGQCKLSVVRKGVKHRITFNVLQGKYTPILSLDASEGMGLLKIKDCDPLDYVCTVNESSKLTEIDLKAEYADVFRGLGRLKDSYSIEIDDSIRPVVHAPRRIPVPMRNKVHEKLEQLVNEGVITPVTDATDWVSSMVVVQKPNSQIRLCLDTKDLNVAIRCEYYPMPTIEEVSTRLNKARFITVLDAKNGFWQISLDDRSSMLTCFNTPFGRYRWMRMPFGINSAPEVWQRTMNQLVEGLKGTEVIHDDFLIVGCGDTDDEAEADHDRNLKAFLERARECNLRLNADKLKLKMTQVPYIGHLLTREGLRVDPKKVEAIKEMPVPKDAKAVQRLLGSVNYLAKFVPHLSNIMQPLRRLLDKDTEWCWLHTHQQAFDEMKKALTTTPALSYYDVMKPVVIQCDASDSGLGAALLQNGLPVAYSSRALTSAETNYAQIEKELLAIVFACEKFDQYVYGRDKVHVQSDHKPLEVIFKRPLVTAPKRLQRMLLRLQRYSIEVTYVRGSEMNIADTLSRAYIPGNASVHAVTFENIDMTEGLSVSPSRLQELRDATASDCVLQKLIQVTLGGWPSQKSDTDLDVRAYYNVRHELTMQNGLVFKDNRIVVPTSVRKDIIATVHRSHQGIQGCIRRAKDTVYWPLMNQEITDYVNQCRVCNTYRPEQCKEPLMPHAVPDRPWAKVGADLFELQGQHYLLLVDYYSNFFELARLGSNTRAMCVIDAMRSQFARHGSPEVLVSDNGPQFACREFRTFTQLWDIEHVTSSPRYPQSNGQAERAIGTVKNLMKKALEDGSDVQLALQSFRNTVREGYSASPAQLLFSRRCRTSLPMQRTMLKPQLVVDVPRERKAMKDAQRLQYNKSSHQLAPIAPGSSIRMKLPNQDTWTLGECTKKLAKRSYLVILNGQTYRRNRRALRVVNECPPLPERDTPMPLHSREASASLPPVDDNVPQSEDAPHHEDPVVMHDMPSIDVSPSRAVLAPTRVETSPVRRGTRARKLPAYLADYQP